MGMDFRVLVWKRVCKITFFGLKSDQDLKNRAAHPHEEFSEVTPPGLQLYFKVSPQINSMSRWRVAMNWKTF